FKDGLVSHTLLLLGFTDRPVQIMYTMTGVIIALAQVLLPLMVLTLYGVFKSIDRDLEYAAMSLGARPSVALALVTLRLARGGNPAMTISWRSPVGVLLLMLCGITFLYLVLPILVVVIAPLGGTGYLAFPPQGMTTKWYAAALKDSRYLAAVLVSLRIAIASA